MPDLWIIVVLIAGAASTYVWRALGVALSGRIDPTGPVFEWVGCVAYALLAALIARMIVMPVGPLEATDLGARLISAAIAVAAFFLARKNIFFGVTAGTMALIGFTMAGIRLF
jgi:branched-subunit amino acid transport protein